MNPTRWLTTREAAEYLAMHPDTMRRLLRRGDIPAKRTPGGRYKVPVSALDDFTARMEDAA